MFAINNKTNLIYTRPVSKDHFTYLEITLITIPTASGGRIDPSWFINGGKGPERDSECLGSHRGPAKFSPEPLSPASREHRIQENLHLSFKSDFKDKTSPRKYPGIPLLGELHTMAEALQPPLQRQDTALMGSQPDGSEECLKEELGPRLCRPALPPWQSPVPTGAAPAPLMWTPARPPAPGLLMLREMVWEPGRLRQGPRGPQQTLPLPRRLTPPVPKPVSTPPCMVLWRVRTDRRTSPPSAPRISLQVRGGGRTPADYRRVPSPSGSTRMKSPATAVADLQHTQKGAQGGDQEWCALCPGGNWQNGPSDSEIFSGEDLMNPTACIVSYLVKH